MLGLTKKISLRYKNWHNVRTHNYIHQAQCHYYSHRCPLRWSKQSASLLEINLYIVFKPTGAYQINLYAACVWILRKRHRRPNNQTSVSNDIVMHNYILLVFGSWATGLLAEKNCSCWHLLAELISCTCWRAHSPQQQCT